MSSAHAAARLLPSGCLATCTRTARCHWLRLACLLLPLRLGGALGTCGGLGTWRKIRAPTALQTSSRVEQQPQAQLTPDSALRMKLARIRPFWSRGGPNTPHPTTQRPVSLREETPRVTTGLHPQAGEQHGPDNHHPPGDVGPVHQQQILVSRTKRINTCPQGPWLGKFIAAAVGTDTPSRLSKPPRSRAAPASHLLIGCTERPWGRSVPSRGLVCGASADGPWVDPMEGAEAGLLGDLQQICGSVVPRLPWEDRTAGAGQRGAGAGIDFRVSGELRPCLCVTLSKWLDFSASHFHDIHFKEQVYGRLMQQRESRHTCGG